MLFNDDYLEKFKSTPNHEKAIFLPQCLRSPQCKARISPEGFLCINCGKCRIGKFKQKAQLLGYKVFILPGASCIKNIIKKYRFTFVLGIACQPELLSGIKLMEKNNIPSIGIRLLNDGCVNTQVDWSLVYEVVGIDEG